MTNEQLLETVMAAYDAESVGARQDFECDVERAIAEQELDRSFEIRVMANALSFFLDRA